MMLKELMTRHVTPLRPDESVREALLRMDACGAGVLPVCEERRLVGLLERRRVEDRGGALPPRVAHRPVREAMSAVAAVGREEEDVRDALRTMRQQGMCTLPVVDRRGELVGMFSLGEQLDTRLRFDRGSRRARTGT